MRAASADSHRACWPNTTICRHQPAIPEGALTGPGEGCRSVRRGTGREACCVCEDLRLSGPPIVRTSVCDVSHKSKCHREMYPSRQGSSPHQMQPNRGHSGPCVACGPVDREPSHSNVWRLHQQHHDVDLHFFSVSSATHFQSSFLSSATQPLNVYV